MAYSSAEGIVLAAALRLAPLRPGDCRWGPAYLGQRVWSGYSWFAVIPARGGLAFHGVSPATPCQDRTFSGLSHFWSTMNLIWLVLLV